LPASEVEDLVAKAREHSAFDLTAATTDGWVLTQSPQQAFLNGSIQKVSLLIGINGRELSAFRLSAAAAAKTSGNQNSPAETGALKKFSAAAHPYFGIWTDAAIVRYFGKILVSKTAALDQAANDLIGACPVGAMANLAYASGQRVFVYRFEREIPGKGEAELGAFHSLEVPYVFGSLSDREWQWLPSTAEDAALSNLIQTYWTNFAKSGDPNAPGLPNWPGWSDAATEFLVINKDASVSAQRNFPPIFSHVGVKDLRKSFSAPR
jgi:para-nitrobenzyl esterase